jgi:hypothetical protein
LWDVERTLAGPATGGNAVGGPAEGKKRKKGNGKEMGVGEVWRARNVSQDKKIPPTPLASLPFFTSHPRHQRISFTLYRCRTTTSPSQRPSITPASPSYPRRTARHRNPAW